MSNFHTVKYLDTKFATYLEIVFQLLQKVNVYRKVNITKMITYILKLTLLKGKRTLYR